MTIQFVNVTVDTTGLYEVQTRDYGTVALVGVGSAVSGSTPEATLFGSYAEVDTAYPSSNDLSTGIKNAFANGASSVWAVDIYEKNAANVENGLDAVLNKDVQIVSIANTIETNSDTYVSVNLKNHCDAAVTERVGVFMLDTDEDADTCPTAIAQLATSNESRLFGVAHKSSDDIGSIVAGKLASIRPWESAILKTLSGASQTGSFTSTQISGLDAIHINPVVDPVYLTGTGLVLGTDYTTGSESEGIYRVDIRRTLDDISYKLKAGLTNPNIIGNIRISKPGLSELTGIISGLLQVAVNEGEIESFSIAMPVLNALAKDVNSRSPAETTLITTARTTRVVDTEVTVEYSGAIHTINVDLKFTA